MRSARNTPSNGPAIVPAVIAVKKPSERVTLSPCLTKNDGIHAVMLYEPTRQVTLTAIDSRVRRITGRVNSTRIGTRTGASIGTMTGAGSTRPRPASTWAASRSIACSTASASSERPICSSQRGDSGSLWRSHHTHSAPTPPIRNMARQPSRGIATRLVSDTANTPELEIRLSNAMNCPRRAGGTNSEIMP